MLPPKDREIIRELVRDADRSRKTIATAVGVSEPNLSKRIGTLQDTKVITRFTVDVDYELVGYSTHAFSLVKFRGQDAASTRAVVDRVVKLNEAVEVYSTLGETDLYVRWVCKNNAGLMGALSHLTDNPNVAHVETVTLAEAHKRERGPGLDQ